MDASGSNPKKDRVRPSSWLCPTLPDITLFESSAPEKSELSSASMSGTDIALPNSKALPDMRKAICLTIALLMRFI
jgi:hypothetical protein